LPLTRQFTLPVSDFAAFDKHLTSGMSQKRSADTRELLAPEHVHQPVSPDPGSQENAARIIGYHFPDSSGIPSERMRLHGREHRARALRGDHDEHFPFVCHVERVEPQDFARPGDIFAHRDYFFEKADPGRMFAIRLRRRRSAAVGPEDMDAG